ncbi:hypothetical protein [Streptomyces griseorubiginosus]|uniref:hypothetical protein n=1 Tax=Streptomyces griseorubiginosus TaxID=67304 RepID=UPI00364E7F2D
MTYVVTVDTRIPEGTPEMDPLQRAGAVALLEDGFQSVKSLEGADGAEAELLDSIVAVHPDGALLKVFVDAPALEFAEDAVQVLVDELLERSELLADWRIERCEVELHQDLAKESLDAADGPDAPPDDPAVRKARHTQPPAGERVGEEYDADVRAKSVRNRMLELADRLRSFPPAAFGVLDGAEGQEGEAGGFSVSPEGAALVAGALVLATDVLVAELFEDVQVLTQEDSSVAECEGPLWHLERLPDRYALRYDGLFARRFLVTVIALTTRFTDGSFRRLGCVAEELALRFLLREATATLEVYGLLDDDVSVALDAFAGHVFEDMDHEWLHDGSMDGDDEETLGDALGIELVAFEEWFTPFDEGRYVHPSVADGPEEARR